MNRLKPLLCGLAFGIAIEGITQEDTRNHWEKASRNPDRIVLTWAGEPSTTQAVTWRTDTSVSQGVAEIALAEGSPKFVDSADRVIAQSQPFEAGAANYNSDEKVRFHSAFFTGLDPDTLYAYRVGDGESVWSEWFQFRTAKAEVAPFSFAYVGDAQNGLLSHWSRLIRSAYSRDPQMDFIIHAGDLVNTAHMDLEWAQWFHALGWIHGQTPALPVPGNHEYGNFGGERQLSVQWQPQFALPVVEELDPSIQETAYVIDYQGARIIGLNSLNRVEEQTPWLEKQLTDNPNPWTIVTFHYPIFASAVNRDNLRLRSAWKPLFDQYSVDIILQGHDHTYARGHVSTPGGEEGEITSVYVNSVSGSKMYTVKPDRWEGYAKEGATVSRMAENTQLFQWIEVNGDTLAYEARMATGELYDAFQLKKREGKPNLLVEDPISSTPERSWDTTPGSR